MRIPPLYIDTTDSMGHGKLRSRSHFAQSIIESRSSSTTITALLNTGGASEHQKLSRKIFNTRIGKSKITYLDLTSCEIIIYISHIFLYSFYH